ncbi:MAG: oligoribonuclease [Patescibacteria group bacterium]|nr:oligoribonuclease [Candidatus Saccharibacteria bacterium]MDQ5963500.1 oligoribonuclease [Patescibacteria group bacterium]
MTEIDKKAVPTKLLWVDLEMTGLDVEQDVILEVAAEITDMHFNTLASYEAIVQQPHETLVRRFAKNAWWQNYPENRDEFLKKCADGKPSGQVEKELIDLIERQFGSEPAILSGNSIHNDRNFIKQWWPALDLKLHYRMLDVSAWKVFMQGRYGVSFEKKEVHRAFDDIQASIAELQHYLEWFGQDSS